MATLAHAAVPSYIIQTIAGSDFTGDGGPAAKALLATVEGLAADALGNYYLADTDSHRIRRISPKGIITTIAGTGKPGYSGDGGPATAAQLNLPYGLATDFSGNLYVADFGNHCVRKISPDGRIATVAAQLAGPRNLTTDAAGNLYISDFIASRVYRLTPQGMLTAIAGAPQATTLGDNGPATQAGLKNPAGVAIDLAGNLYIADSGNKRIRRVTSGVITSVNATLSTPVGLAINYTNELYAADAGAGQLVRITSLNSGKPIVTKWVQGCREVAVDYYGGTLIAQGNTVKQFNGSSFALLAGGHDFNFAGDENNAISARLNRPQGLARDPAGNLYIADSANKRIRRITPDGIIHTFLDGLASPTGLAFDNFTGNLYIADADSILVSRPDGTLSTLVGASGQLNRPSAVAMDSATGWLYIADEGNNRIRVVTPDGKIDTHAKLQAPAGLAIDAHGILYAAESAAGRIVKVSPSGLVHAISEAGVWITPRGLAVDDDGTLYITDPGTHKITRIDRNGVVSLAAGTGTQNFSGDGGSGALASLDAPAGVLVDPKGVVYISDSGNNRIRTLSADTAPSVAAPLRLISVVNAASRLPGPIAAGELITILGANAATDDIQINSTSVLPVSSKQGEATVAVPDSVGVGGIIEIQLLTAGVPQARVTAPLASAAIGVFPAMTRNEDGTLNSIDNPAPRGTVIKVYGTGEGRAGVAVTATLAGQPVDIVSVGPSPDTPGIFELIAFLPSGYFPAGAMALLVSSGASTSQPGVTVFVH